MHYLYKKLSDPKLYDLKDKIVEKIITFGRDPAKEFLLEQIKPKKGDKILDVGCGTGRYAIFSGEYIGIDTDEKYIEYAKEKYRGTFLAMDAAHLEFPDDNFDYIFSAYVFHHIPDEQVDKVISEMKRVCKKGGKILIIDFVIPNKINFLGYLLAKLDRGKYVRTFDELNGLISKHNFRLLTQNIKGSFPSRAPVFYYQK